MRIVEKVRSLRKNQTEAEKRLWRYLRNRQVNNYKFYRQMKIGMYVVDFVCRDRGLIIEADGGQHSENMNDKTRDRFLESQGYKVISFWKHDILENTEGVLNMIKQELEALTPALSLKGEGARA